MQIIRPYAHQKEILQINPKKCGLWWEMGAGKTYTATWLAEQNAKTVLVVCPKPLKEQWISEIRECRTNNTTTFIVVTKENFKKNIQKIPRVDCIICDEAHLGFANYKSQLHKALAAYLKTYSPNCVYLLTGTPYTSSCWSIYSLGLLLGRDWSWWEWKNRYFDMIKMGSIRVPKQKSGIEKEIAIITNRLGYVKRLDELAEIPEQTFLTETFDLNKKQKKAIEDLIDIQPIVRFTKIHQIESGCLKDENMIIDCDKTARIIELCEANKKIAIVARYNLQLENYKKILSKKFKNIYIINGETENKSEIVDKVNGSDEAIVLINSMCAAGYNLWSVPIMVFASMDFSYVNYLQIKGRILRMNHLKKNVYINLITSGKSIDRAVYNCMLTKKDFTTEVMAHEKYDGI